MSERESLNPTYRPDKVTIIAVLSLINGIINIFWALGITIAAVSTVVGICLVPLTILPIILAGVEIAYAAKLFSNPARAVKPATTIAILDILCILQGNFISMVVGIILLVFYNDIEVIDWFRQLNESSPGAALL